MKLYLGLAICVALGLIFAATLVLSMISDARLRRWPTAAATVLESTIRLHSVGGTGSTVRRASGHPEYRLEVRYAYEIAGRSYTGDRLSNHPPSQILGDVSEAPAPWLAALRDQYAPGKPTQAHYDPERPEASYLQFRASSELWVLGGCSLAFFALAIVLWRYAPR